MTRIVLIHATRVAMEPIETAFAALWPAAETVSILEEGLSLDLAAGRVSRQALDDRICRLAAYARDLAPAGILYTCSSFGSGTETAARALDVPVLKPNEAMFEAALRAGGRIAMLYSFPPAAESMEREFSEAASAAGQGSALRPVFVAGALDALKAGDAARHDRLVAEAAGRVVDADAIMLAHFSMARAASGVRATTSLPVFTSPETAIAKLRRLVSAGAGKAATC